jgi:hypothetical protein
MSWFKRDNQMRAAELDMMAYMTWQRRSKDRWHQVRVRLADPTDRHSAYVVVHPDKTSPPMKKTKEVQKYIRRFFDNLLYNGNDAPDDIFLDSMKSVTAKKAK